MHTMIQRPPDVLPKAAQTLFGRFLETLSEETSVPIRLPGGIATLHTLPWERVVADGIWPICDSIAKKTGNSLATEHSLLEHIAPHVDDFIGIGILLAYTSPEEAARAFQTHITTHVLQKAANSGDETLVLLQHWWQKPAAEFFASLFHVCRAWKTRIEHAAQQLEPLKEMTDRIQAEREVGIELHAHTSHCEQLTAWLDPAVIMPRRIDLWNVKSITQCIEGVHRSIACSGALFASITNIPSHLIGVSLSEETWLNTHLLLAAINAPFEQEYLQKKDYTAGVLAIRTLQDKELIARFKERLRQRRTPLTSKTEEVISRWAKELLGFIRKWDPFKLDAYTVGVVIIDLLSEDTSESLWSETHIQEVMTWLNHDATTAVLESDRGGILGNTLQKDDPAQSAQYAGAIRWKNLTPTGVCRLLDERVMLPQDIAEHLPKLPKDLREEAAKIIYDALEQRAHTHEPPSQETVGKLLRQGFTPPLQLLKCGYALPTSILEKRIQWLWRSMENPTEDVIRECIRDLPHVWKQLSTSRQEALLKKPALRMPLCYLLYALGVFLNDNPAASHLVFLLLRKTATPEQWAQLVLGAVELYRQEDAQSLLTVLKKKPSNTPRPFPPWSDAWREYVFVKLFTGNAHMQPFKTLLKQQTERATHEWVFAHAPVRRRKQAEADWLTYQRIQEECEVHLDAMGRGKKTKKSRS